MLRMRFSPHYFSKLITTLNNDFPKPFSPVFTFSNHDRRRNLRRLKGDTEKYRLVQFIQFTTRSVPCFYYGEEIGMQGVKRPYKYALDPLGQKYKHVPRFLFDMINESINRDEMRTPMQWDTTINAGFTKGGSTWLPIEKEFKRVNVQAALHDSSSLYYSTQQLLRLRNTLQPVKEGELTMINNKDLPSGVIGYKRSFGGESVFIYINFSKQKKVIKHVEGNAIIHSIKKTDTIQNGNITL
jgi:glycosidase